MRVHIVDTAVVRQIEGAVLRRELKARAKHLFDTLERAVMPRRCVFCGILANSNERYVCLACHDDLPWNKLSCPRCATPASSECSAGVLCAACQVTPPPYTATIAPLEYAFPVDAAIKALKFRRKLHYVPAFSDILRDAARQLPADIDAILPVPLHRWRQIRRGFNQSVELATPLQKHLSVPVIRSVIRKKVTPYQSGLNAQQRARNLESAFRVQATISAQHVLIVDDVITTGATCSALATLLLGNGVTRVSVLALARASR